MPAPAPPARLVKSARHAGAGARYYAVGLLKRLFTYPVPLWAQAIAFKVLVTLLPLVLLATGVLGIVLRQANPFETVAGYLRSFLAPTLSEPLVSLVFQLQRASGTLTLVGSLGLVVAAISLFATLRYVVGQAMGVGRHTERALHYGYLFDARMALQVGLLFLLSLGVTFAVTLFRDYTVVWAVDVGLDPTFLQRVWRVVFRALTLLVPFALSVGMFTQLYYFVPRPHPPLRSAAVGATVTAVLFEAAKNAFTLYARYVGDFNSYASGPGDTLGGLFGLILGFVFWVYLSGLVFVIGTMVVALHEGRHTPRTRGLTQWLRRRFHRRQHPVPGASGGIPGHAEPSEEPSDDASGEPADATGGAPAHGEHTDLKEAETEQPEESLGENRATVAPTGAR